VTQAAQRQAENCFLCGGEGERLFCAGDSLATTAQQFSILRCRRCGLHRLSPSPSFAEALDFYPVDYEPFRALRDARLNAWQRWLRRRHWRLRCRAVRRFRDGGTLLDAGCSTGDFLHELRQDGDWQVVGVEVNAQAAAYAQQVLGLTVHQADFCTLDLPPHTFDVVTMWDVIEHVPDPLGALQAVARLLEPGGVLLLSTPNARAWQARLWARWWCGWEIPRHFYVFTRPTLEQLLAQAGFHVTRRLHFPAERFYLVESWRRQLEYGPPGILRRWRKHLPVYVGVVLWPLLRLLDLTAFASQIVVAATIHEGVTDEE
jgi:SAM-dependent methyltransferase